MISNLPAAEIASRPNQQAAAQPRPWLAAWMLCWREIVRFVRQRNRVFGALAQPIIFWLLFSAGMDRSFHVSSSSEPGQPFWQYYIPGTLVLILLFTAIFATISIIEDRREGFLQSVLVAPIPRWSMVLGKVLGGSLIALAQGLIFLFLALLLIGIAGWLKLVALVALLFVTALALTSLGFVIAWRMESTQGFHAIMTVVLMPLWLLSGAFFLVPTQDASGVQLVMHWIMRLNPVTYSVAGVRQLLHADLPEGVFYTPGLATCWAVTGLFAIVMFAASCKIAAQRIKGDLL